MGTSKIFSALFASVAAFVLFGVAGRVEAQAPVAVSLTPLRFEFAAWPGERLSGTVRVANLTDELLPVVMEVEDFVPRGEEGRVAVGPGDEAYSLKDWVRFDLAAFTIFPEQQFTVDFTVELPTDAEPGSRFGTILARTTAEPVGPGPRVVTKIGSLVLVDVYGEVRVELSVVEMQAPGFGFALPLPLAVRFVNSGTVHVKPRGRFVISNMFGKRVAEIPVPEKNVLPGSIRRVEVPVGEGLLAGRYRAKLEATYGRENRIPITAEQSFWFVDWRNVGVPSLIFIGLAVFLIAKRREIALEFRPSGARGESMPVAPTPEDGGTPARERRGGGRTPRKMDL